MRSSQLFLRTLREPPSDAETISHQLLVRAGFVRQLTAGVYSLLPLGQRVLLKIAAIVREEMNAAGGQEFTLPILQPLELWTTQPARGVSRAEELGAALFRLKDRRGRDLALGPTHEEVITLLAKEFVRSYRDLPLRLYQIQTKFRDEPRPRGGLIRMREFWMKDLYSFDADAEGLDASYQAMVQAYRRIFKRCGVEALLVEADSGAIGGKDSQEFLAPGEAGEDDALICSRCGYAANREKAEFVRIPLPDETEGGLVMALVRGDLEINEIKLFNAITRAGLNATDLHLATREELQKVGSVVAGFTSPVGQRGAVLIIADTSVQTGKNFVAGANRADYHLRNVNAGRDFRVDVWADIASAYAGASCARCGGSLSVQRGVELGHLFKVGLKYSKLFNAAFLGEDGQEHLMLMGCYGLGLGRVMAMAVEQHHDERGICWPSAIAPYQAALCVLGTDDTGVTRAADDLYEQLCKAGIEVLYDDRLESAGVKFNDADLIGLPLRAVVSKRSLKNGGIELKLRSQKESRIVPLAEAVSVIQEEIRRGIAEGR